MDQNQAITTGNEDAAGGAIMIQSAGSEILQDIAPKVALFGTQVSGNGGTSIITSTGDFADVQLHGVALVDNVASSYLVDIGATTSALLGVYASTIAGNASGGAASRSIQRSTAVSFRFRNSIHWQPGKRITSTLGLGASDIDYVLANDATDGAPANHGTSADPQFADAAAHDYGLNLSSPAIDFAPASADPTADHDARVVDLAPVANQYGAQDLGAYERQSACAADTIFCSGFDL